jgi:hypothetical protein
MVERSPSTSVPAPARAKTKPLVTGGERAIPPAEEAILHRIVGLLLP